MKRLAAAAIYGKLFLGVASQVNAEPQQEVIRQWHCDVRAQGEPRLMIRQCTSSPSPHSQTCWEIKTTYADGRYTDTVRFNPAH